MAAQPTRSLISPRTRAVPPAIHNRPLPTLPKSSSPPPRRRVDNDSSNLHQHHGPHASSTSSSSSSSHQQNSSSSSSSGSFNSRPEEHEIARSIRPTRPHTHDRGYASDPDTPPQTRHHQSQSFRIVRGPNQRNNRARRHNQRPVQRQIPPSKTRVAPTTTTPSRSQSPPRDPTNPPTEQSHPPMIHQSSDPLITQIPPPPPLPAEWTPSTNTRSHSPNSKHHHASTVTSGFNLASLPARSEPVLSGPLGPSSMGRAGTDRVERVQNLNVPGHRTLVRPKQRMNDSTKWKRGSLIGVGSFGKVYMAMNTETGELLAVKQIPTVNTSEAALQQLDNEVSIMRTLSHPHIVALYGIQRTEEHLNILMEYVPGKSLDTIYKTFGPLSEETIQKYLYQCVEGLTFAHENHVIHRDIKGKNILVDNLGVIKLADFGSAKVLDATMASELQPSMGYQYTPLWTAPEVMLGNYDEKVDVWSIGCVLIEIATADSPWAECDFKNPFAALYHIGNTDAIPKWPETLSPQCQDFLRCCLIRDPSNRWTARQLLDHEFLQDVYIPALHNYG